MDEEQEKKMLEIWHRNAAAWISAVRENKIESRNLVTNQAIVELIVANRPKTILDVGCGEGWLVRALSEFGISGVGIDVVPELINSATVAGGGHFRQLHYEDIAEAFDGYTFDMAVCNFSLLGNHSVENLVHQLKSVLKRDGAIVIQTLHPQCYGNNRSQKDGWCEEDWQSISEAFSGRMPWYFRTLESWKHLLNKLDIGLEKTIEPRYPRTNQAASIIFLCKLNA